LPARPGSKRHAAHSLTGGLGDDAFTIVAQPAAPTTIAR